MSSFYLMNPERELPGDSVFADNTPGSAQADAAPSRGAGPLDHGHLQQLEHARSRARGVRKAARFASFSGTTTLLFGLLAIPFSLGSGSSLALAIALVAVGYNELSLRRSLLRMERTACRGLALNQLFFAGILIAYAVWKLMTMSTSQGILAQAMAADPGIADQLASSGMLESAQRIERLANLGIYAGLIAGTVIFQGGAALYYTLRARSVNRYLADTPGWIANLNARSLLA